jgi:hypothetical protein
MEPAGRGGRGTRGVVLRPSVALLILTLAVTLGFVSAMATTW